MARVTAAVAVLSLSVAHASTQSPSALPTPVPSAESTECDINITDYDTGLVYKNEEILEFVSAPPGSAAPRHSVPRVVPRLIGRTCVSYCPPFPLLPPPRRPPSPNHEPFSYTPPPHAHTRLSPSSLLCCGPGRGKAGGDRRDHERLLC